MQNVKIAKIYPKILSWIEIRRRSPPESKHL